jgi:hypothetical protein
LKLKIGNWNWNSQTKAVPPRENDENRDCESLGLGSPEGGPGFENPQFMKGERKMWSSELNELCVSMEMWR